MSLSIPSRRLIGAVPVLTATPTTIATTTITSPTALLPALQSLTLTGTPSYFSSPSSQHRSLHTTPPNHWFWNRKKKTTSPGSLEDQLSGTKQTRQALIEQMNNKVEGPAIFDDEVQKPSAQQADGKGAGKGGIKKTKSGASLAHEHLARAIDPDPRSRARWERKMIIQKIRNGTNPYSHEPRTALIKRTERENLTQSTFLPTSTKKLVHLARQIQGKTLDEALAQMRFSKKKMAAEVAFQLELARDRAIATRGMGLGLDAHGNKMDNPIRTVAEAYGLQTIRDVDGKEIVHIQTKDGRWIKIDDPTRLYVAEAWVTRGPWRDKVPEYRARGRLNVIHRPSAGIAIRLKEEKTRIREAAECEAKRLRQDPWVHLPDRPINGQQQWYSW
ncbi:hypothetical protein VTJ04DRAFT_9621 [Mycothermus thermophilus]|uniref:mitochondrial 54S ribosomal protein uL22m n=1 Tax=Humicola insolens TaxID=85995 RepID=UPI003743F06B